MVSVFVFSKEHADPGAGPLNEQASLFYVVEAREEIAKQTFEHGV